MKISEAIVAYLEELGVRNVFGVPAGTTGAIWDSLNDSSIKAIINKHEANSVYSATNYADVSKKLGVCILAGGVGVANGFNGIVDADRRCLPVLIVSGYAQTSQIGKGAIQEYNTGKLSHTEFVICVDDFIECMHNAIIRLKFDSEPVQLIVPMDIQTEEINISRKDIVKNVVSLNDNSYVKYKEYLYTPMVQDFLRNKGIIFVGRGAYGCGDKIIELSQKLGWNIITTPEAKGVVSVDYEYNLGTYGFYGTDIATEYVENEDFKYVLVLGSSLGESATRNFNDALTKDRLVVQVDKDANKDGKSDTFIETTVENFLSETLVRILASDNNSEQLTKTQGTGFNKNEAIKGTGLSVQRFVQDFPRIMDTDTMISCDIGEYMNFVYKYLEVRGNNKFLSSLNYGSMGVMVGGSIGTALAHEGITTVICGDGSFFMNGMEILTAKQYKLPIVYFVINNAMLGYVEHGQKFIYGRSIEGVVQDRISIARMARTMGIRGYAVKTNNTLNKLIKQIKDNYEINGLHEPIVVEIITNGTEILANADRFKALKGE